MGGFDLQACFSEVVLETEDKKVILSCGQFLWAWIPWIRLFCSNNVTKMHETSAALGWK